MGDAARHESAPDLVGAEGQVHDDKGPADPPDNALSVVNHLVQGHRERGIMPCHDVGSRVPHKDAVHSLWVPGGGGGG